MKIRLTLTLLAAMLIATPAFADPAAAIARAAQSAQGSVVVVQFSYGAGQEMQRGAGQGLCIDAANGVVMTMAIPAQVDVRRLADIELVLPGPQRRTVPAELMGIDGVTGVGFVRARGEHGLRAASFAQASNLRPGNLVVAAGIMPGDPANSVYYGVAYVSTQLRLPDHIVRVTGGALTSGGSPVYNANGQVIGMVMRQLFENHHARTQTGVIPMPLRSLQGASYFTPVEEFAYLLQSIPTDGQVRRQGWIGAGMRAVPEAIAEVYDTPVVRVTNVLPGHPAARVGLREDEVVVAVNGRPLEALPTPELVRVRAMQMLTRIPAGQPVRLTVLRDGRRVDVQVPIEPMPLMAEEAPQLISRDHGMVLREQVLLDSLLMERPATVEGLIVVQVAPQSPAGQAGLHTDDVVTHINGRAVRTVAGAREAIPGPTSALRLNVHRGNEQIVVNVPGTE